ncbi:MAG: hypothetical protein EOO60_13950, partial [Hymenobacter sp.]
MFYLLVSWLILAGLTIEFAVAQQSTQSLAQAAANTYVRRIDADKNLITVRHMQTYGHPLRPGKDSLLVDYGSDFPSSAIFYYANQHLVKIIETARTSRTICENIYYLKNDHLVLVSQKQVACSIEYQRAIWLQQMPRKYRAENYYFSGTYVFAADSCVAQREHGKPEFEVNALNMSNRHGTTLCHFFPLQA